MKKLGRGWQYTTYDIGNGRVLKKLNSRFLSYCMMAYDSFPFQVNPPWKYPAFYRRSIKEALSSIEIIKTTKLPMWMFGNPRYVGEMNYEQDLATPIYKLMPTISKEKGELIIDEFIALNKVLVENNLIDRGFVITTNFSISHDGKVILTDLGELYKDKDEIAAVIKTRPWTEAHLLYNLPKSLHQYFVLGMDEAFLS